MYLPGTNVLLTRFLSPSGVAEGSDELGGLLPLECNLAGLNAISFDKGCYI